MSPRPEAHLQLLSVFKNSNANVKKAILKNSDDCFIDLLAEICYNYLRGNIACSQKQFKELSKHKKCLRKIVDINISKNRKTSGKVIKRKKQSERTILLQKGDGFWFALLPLVTELTTRFISQALQK